MFWSAILADPSLPAHGQSKKERSRGEIPVCRFPTPPSCRQWSGVVIIWAHPDGKSSLFDDSGEPRAAVRNLLDARSAVIAPDSFSQRRIHRPRRRPAEAATVYEHQAAYGGFYYGYNQGVLARRTSDLLSCIALCRDGRESNPSALWVLGPPECRAPGRRPGRRRRRQGRHRSASLQFFQYSRCHRRHDAPRPLKYGGTWGFVPLCTGTLSLFDPPADPPTELVNKMTNVKVIEGDADDEKVLNGISSIRP